MLDSLWVTNAGSYSFIANDTNSCKLLSDTIVISENDLPNVDISILDNHLMCDLYPVVLQASNINSYWSNGVFSEQIDVNSNGNYWCYVQDTNGCIGYSDTILIGFNSPSIADISVTGANSLFCRDDALHFQVVNYAQFKSIYWQGQSSSANYTTRLDSSTYIYVQLKDNYNCITTDSVFVNVVDCPDEFNLIAPNPADKSCVISSSTLIKSISVFDDNGKLITEIKDLEFFNYNLNTAIYASGSYFIQINDTLLFKLLVIHK